MSCISLCQRYLRRSLISVGFVWVVLCSSARAPAQTSLRAWVSLEPLGDALDRPGDDRARALERLSSIGSAASVAVLVRWLEEHPALALEDWLEVSRALAPHADRPAARRWLGKLLSGAPLMDTREDDSLRMLVRATAAVGLARAGDERSLAVLGRALRQTPAQARLAQSALLAYPPRRIEPLLKAPGAPTLEYVQTLEELGDQRAFHPLRALVRRGTPEIQARAILALFRLGHLETVEVAAHWAQNQSRHPALVRTSAELLLAVEHPRAPAALEKLLESSAPEAIELAARFPSPHLVPVLEKAFSTLTPSLQVQTSTILGAVGGRAALELLGRKLRTPGLSSAAAFALGKSPDPGAATVLLGALDDPKSGLLATRALVMRGWLHGERWPELEQHLERLAQSRQLSQRWVAHWGLGVASESYAVSLLEQDVVSAAAAAATVLVHSPAVARAAVRRLDASAQLSATEQPRREVLQRQAALLSGLARPEAHRDLGSSSAHELLARQPELAVTLAPILTSRADDPRPSVGQALLESPDVNVRAAAFRGLPGQRSRATLGTLRRAYGVELDPRVRRALVRGASLLPDSVSKRRFLVRAAEFDPDAGVRQLARLGGTEPVPPAAVGQQAVWLELPNVAAGQVLQLVSEDGRGFPVVRPPDGVVVMLGFPDVEFTVRWTPEAQPAGKALGSADQARSGQPDRHPD